MKLKETQIGDTLCDKQSPIVYDAVEYPEAAIAFAIEPKSRQDEEKISVALHKILEEDPALHFSRDAQTKEFLLSGSGQLHVETVVEKLKKRYSVEVTVASAEGALQRDDYSTSRGSGPSQETDRWSRTIW